ncbi:uncharacterized protein ACIQIH_012551 [Cyanocitta cristata]
MGKNSRGEKRAPSMCWRTASGEWLRTLSPKKVNARCGGRRTKGGRCSRHRPGSVRLRWARSGRPFVRRGSEGRSAPLRASPAAATTAAAAAAAAAPPPARPPAREVPVPVSAGRGACAPLRPCGGAARPAERCGATSSAEQEETVIYKRFLPDLSCLLSNEGALSITHPAEWKNTGTASSLLGRGEPKGRGVGEEGPCRRHGGGARVGRRPRAGGEGRAGAGQRSPGRGRRLEVPPRAARPPPAAAEGSGAVPSRPAGPGPRPTTAAAGRERSEGSRPLICSRYVSFSYTFLIVIFCLYTKSALLTDKASHGAVTGDAQALVLLLRGQFSPWPPPGELWTRCRSARLWGQVWSCSRLLLGEATRERGLAGAWEAGISLLCRAASLKRDPRHRKVPVAAGEQSTAGAIGGENVQGNVLFCVGFHRTESRSFSPAGERVYDSNVSLLSYLHPLWCS